MVIVFLCFINISCFNSPFHCQEIYFLNWQLLLGLDLKSDIDSSLIDSQKINVICFESNADYQ